MLKVITKYFQSTVFQLFKGKKGEERLFFTLVLLGGAGSGLIAVSLEWSVHFLTHGLNSLPLALKLLGGLVLILSSGLISTRYFKDASGSGVPSVRLALAVHNGRLRFRDTVAKFFATAFSLASGFSLGSEGPTVRIAAGIGSKFGSLFHLSKKRVKSLVAVGTAGGIAAAFNTPIAAVLFTLEEVVGNLNSKILGPVIISSVIASVVGFAFRGNRPTFADLEYQLHSNYEFLIYLAVGLCAALLAPLWVATIMRIRKLNKGIFKDHEMMLIFVTFVLLMIMAQYNPLILGSGKESIVKVLLSMVTDWKVLSILFVLKFFATAICFSSGVSGGIFLPTLFMGATLGALVATVAKVFLPEMALSIGAFALVGMGSFFICVIRAPFTSIIMIFEMTRDYNIILPLMISNISAYMISAKFQSGSIYELLSEQDGIRLPTREDDDVLETMIVEEAMVREVKTLGHLVSVKEVIQKMKENDLSGYPVLKNGLLYGIVAVNEIGQLYAKRKGDTIIDEICQKNVITIYPDQSLLVAFHKLKKYQISRLPVVSRLNDKKLVGIITAEDIVTRFGYHIELKEQKEVINQYETQHDNQES